MSVVNLTIKGLAAGIALAAATISASAQDGSALKIGTSLSQMPWGFQNDQQRPTGVDVALWGGFAKQIGKTAEFINLDFKGVDPGPSGQALRSRLRGDVHHARA